MAEETNERSKKTCANPPCTCPVEDREKFCSVHCQSTGGTTQIDCDCGHDTCKGDF